ncbi:thiamine phosphate synthase [Ferrovibrio sp.]|uniref:thiamine phosphate synthase n=1 Tax=Ferrovibrio sp. TaxID=1917215 RepID=UPI00262485D9|nr:thiamine phosphate synthase [Ferrovibrio sp.]
MAKTEAKTAPAQRLYLITPPAIEPKAFAEDLKAALGGGDVACLQLRLKDGEQTASDNAFRRAAEALLPICHEHDVALLINDRPDLAIKLGADGVHVGQEDASYEEARRILGPDRIVGVTCHNSRHLAMEAAEAGADYVAFGAFFPTDTKQPKTRAEPEILAWWSELMEVPCVAIGGITVENCPPLIEAGADFLAVSAGVWRHPEGPAAAVAAFNRAIAKHGRR